MCIFETKRGILVSSGGHVHLKRTLISYSSQAGNMLKMKSTETWQCDY